MKMPFDEAMRVKDQMPKGLFRNVDGQTADTIWLCAIDAAKQYHGIPRKPLTDEEILEAVGWERAEMYMKLTPNFPVEEARKETLKNARAIEAKHCIKE